MRAAPLFRGIVMYDIIIVGAGPAGLTAALYALRADKKVLVIEKETFGGQITYSPKIENYPGFMQVSGNEFAEQLLSQGAYLFAHVYFFVKLFLTRINVGDTVQRHERSIRKLSVYGEGDIIRFFIVFHSFIVFTLTNANQG